MLQAPGAASNFDVHAETWDEGTLETAGISGDHKEIPGVPVTDFIPLCTNKAARGISVWTFVRTVKFSKGGLLPRNSCKMQLFAVPLNGVILLLQS